MAGLQYNFFPTDFFYPRPASVAGAAESAGHKSSLPPLQIPKWPDADNHRDVNHPTSLVLRTTTANKFAGAGVVAVENKRKKKYHHLDG
ncbi:hypothetical protein LINGRAHAP2_LOCUS16496 [Linum grandiflorum]